MGDMEQEISGGKRGLDGKDKEGKKCKVLL